MKHYLFIRNTSQITILTIKQCLNCLTTKLFVKIWNEGCIFSSTSFIIKRWLCVCVLMRERERERESEWESERVRERVREWEREREREREREWERVC